MTDFSQNPPPLLTCPSDEDLAAFIDGRLAPKAKKEILTHLDACERCFDTVSLAMEVVSDAPQPIHPQKPGLFWRNFMLSGSAVAAVILVAVMFGLQSERSQGKDELFLMASNALDSWTQQGHPTTQFRFDLDLPHYQNSKPVDPFRSASGSPRDQRQINAAINALTASLQKHPNDAKALELRLALYLLVDNFAGAQQDAEWLSKHHASVKAEVYQLVTRYLREGKREAAPQQEFQELYQEHPQNRLVVYNYAQILKISGLDPSMEKELWQHYLTLDPSGAFRDAAEANLNQIP